MHALARSSNYAPSRTGKPQVLVLFKFEVFKFEYVDNEFKLLNIVVDVNCKFDMFKFEYVDNEFKLLNIVVDVLFKLLI